MVCPLRVIKSFFLINTSLTGGAKYQIMSVKIKTMQTYDNRIPMRKWAEEDLPEQKMLLKGTFSLSDAELLAIIIGTGIKWTTCRNVLVVVAHFFLAQFAKFIPTTKLIFYLWHEFFRLRFSNYRISSRILFFFLGY